ncbi:hypothetical protein MKW94_021625 [Papaver nudicaule]|uniref:Bidirectional sugar transporter SWEET n=1 Tax=Papaver nudicaule TaxID=74823 RepID=A0AA41UW64_PAPNU|nr:hypothetical protein [Papaver nudicaule]
MVSTHTIIGIIGNAISCCAAEDFSPNPYLLAILNCASWIYNGIVHTDSLLVLTINGFGLVIEILYVAFYLFYANKKQRLSVFKKLIPGALCFVLLVLLLVFLPNPKSQTGIKVDPESGKGIAIGVICVLANIAMYVSPCDILTQVWRTNSVEYMQFWLIVFGFLNGGIWLTYALLEFDAYILASNSTGCLFSLIQLGFYAYFYFKYPPSKNNKITDEKADGGNKIGDEKAYGGKVADMV